MKSKNIVALALLAGMGVVLHAITPPIFMGVKPDMMLVMMFLGILLFTDVKSVVLIGLVSGILSALTTGFPGGQIPNIIDKLITAFIFYGLLSLLKNISAKSIVAIVLTAIGTLISGFIFLTSAYIIVGLPGAFIGLFAASVLPTVLLNAVLMAVLFPITKSINKRTKLNEHAIHL
ncbi:tryptophan transporter [Cytobacillus sp. FSL W7-1323]|uniref:Tryptophan transporter n=1 Tax=Cytobacillus kochii TaxID=859143 RepID=A0A248TDY1_9BACI|nr:MULTISPECIES: tryptophan transporter [Cytobacillus]ASV66332.1 tryptophan transporter [Cytobacillus kochii]MDQ0187723.1 hypothetical protein [Cytobacillus kochii]MEA1851550.1 tryptophan transporter [Cytobacillus sp. OWB-43]MED1605619.1 tryptophan transporter [Cytobacillus kochii]